MMKNIFRNTPLLAAAIGFSFIPVKQGVAQDAGSPESATETALDLTPKRYKVDRYKSIWSERSPFEIIAEDVPEEVDEDPPFEDYSLAGYSKRGNVWRVTVVNLKDPKEKHYLQSGKVTENGFELLNFKPDRNYKKSEITVRRGGKSGNIGFSEKRLRPATGVKGTPGITKAPASNTKRNPKQPAATPNTAQKSGQRSVNNQNTANTANTATAGAKKTDAAAQIRQMLQNRANASQTRTQSSSSGSSKRQPRRRVILPPSR